MYYFLIYSLKLLTMLCVVAFIIGMFRPNLVIFWGNRKTRLMVALIYIGTILIIPLIAETIPISPEQQQKQQAIIQKKAEESKQKEALKIAEKLQKEEAKAKEKAQQEEDKAKEEEVKNFQRAVIEKRDNAIKIAQKLIQDRLLSPSTAKFAPLSNSTADSKLYLKGNDIYEIVSYVDTKNGYGVLIRIPFKITVKYNSEENKWEELACELYSNL